MKKEVNRSPLFYVGDKYKLISEIKTYFPHASDQTIILSTDSEIDQHYYDLMKENVDDEYTLVYDDLSKSSSIISGYFPEEFK